MEARASAIPRANLQLWAEAASLQIVLGLRTTYRAALPHIVVDMWVRREAVAVTGVAAGTKGHQERSEPTGKTGLRGKKNRRKRRDHRESEERSMIVQLDVTNQKRQP